MLQFLGTSVDLKPSPLPESKDSFPTAAQLFSAQSEFLGVNPEKIKAAEIQRGQQIHPSVSEEQIDTITSHYRLAQRDFLGAVEMRRNETPLRVLCAPTARTVDLIIDERAPFALTKKLIDSGKRESLLSAIESGPADGSLIWDKPQNEIELVANIVRWAALCGVEKKRIRVPENLRRSVSESLKAAGLEPLERLGGAAAIATALMPVIGREPTMLSLGPLPAPVLRHLPANTAVVTEDPQIKEIGSMPLAADFIGNFHLVFRGKELKLPPELGPISVNGKAFDPSSIKTLDIILSGSSQASGFGATSLSKTAELGARHELTLLTGMQYLLTKAEVTDYFDHISALHQAGSRIALFYSESKQPNLESDMWREIKERRCVDFIGLNSVEAFDILERIRSRAREDNPLQLSTETISRLEHALTLGASNGDLWESGKESPQWLFESARCLQEVSAIALVRVRGKVLDVLATAAELELSHPEHVRDSQIVSRNLGTLKVANSSGVINDIHELEPLHNIPHGYYLAALQHLKDYALSQGENAADRIHFDCYFKMKAGGFLFAVPPIPFFSRRGGTASAGDTIDATFASEECLGALDEAHRLNRVKQAAKEEYPSGLRLG